MQEIKSIYVNLPVKDLEKTRAFWEGLGFGFNDQFSDEKALCLILQEGVIYSMLLQESFFKTFTDREVADGRSTQVLVAIQVESKEKVVEMVTKALASGGKRYKEAVDHGWMYYDSFADIDGHQWEVMHMG
ncbi:MAG TPA: VOC family protein, partial [Saprospiraceae bacterium]|nr:VOC family protein [Saprospiraceae bacterium]